MTGAFTTRWATIIMLESGRLRVNSDGILDCGDWSKVDLENAISALKQQGWSLVGSVDRKVNHGCIGREAMDLFFRMNKEEEAQ